MCVRQWLYKNNAGGPPFDDLQQQQQQTFFFTFSGYLWARARVKQNKKKYGSDLLTLQFVDDER